MVNEKCVKKNFYHYQGYLMILITPCPADRQLVRTRALLFVVFKLTFLVVEIELNLAKKKALVLLKYSFLVADTRLYTLPCRSVGR